MLLLGIVAYVGIRESKWITNTLVVVKMLICLFVILLGAFYVRAANWSPFIPAGKPPKETRDPKRDLPIGLLGTLGVCTALYIGVSAVLTGMVKYTDIDEGAPISSAFETVGLGWAAVLVGVAAIAGLTSVIPVDIVAMGRIGFAMARDGLLPPARRAPFRTPLSPVLPVLSALLCVALRTNLALETWIRFLVWLLIGFVIYFTYGVRRSRVGRRDEDLTTVG